MARENKVLVLAQGEDAQLAMLRGIPHVIAAGEPAISTARDATVIFNWSGPRELLQAAFAACAGVQWVHSRLAGIDNLLFSELVESPVPVTNGKGVFSPSLGEFALGAVLYFAKDFRRMIRNQMAGRWEQFDVEEIAGQTAGIVGYGDIGKAVASRLRAMGMRVHAVKRHPPAAADPMVDQFFKPEDLREMLQGCDYVIVAAPLTPETFHMIGEPELAAMKSSGVLINVGRGPVIDEPVLIRFLVEGRIKGAGLDVFEHEPLHAGHPFYRLENVLLSPHCADHTGDWLDQAMRFFLKQYRRFELGQPLENIVNKRLGY